MAYMFMAYIVMGYIPMACNSYGIHGYSPFGWQAHRQHALDFAPWQPRSDGRHHPFRACGSLVMAIYVPYRDGLYSCGRCSHGLHCSDQYSYGPYSYGPV